MSEPLTMSPSKRLPPEAYDPVAKTLHWLMAAAILGMVGLGLYMVAQPPSMAAFRMFDFHKSLGLTLMVLAILRLGWRWYKGAPEALTEGTKQWELHLAHIVHILLYVLMIGIPVIGWIGASASGLPMTYFGLGAIPAVTAASEQVQGVALSLHSWLNWLLIAVIGLHIAGALKRHFVLRDATLRRMLPFTGRRN